MRPSTISCTGVDRVFPDGKDHEGPRSAGRKQQRGSAGSAPTIGPNIGIRSIRPPFRSRIPPSSRPSHAWSQFSPSIPTHDSTRPRSRQCGRTTQYLRPVPPDQKDRSYPHRAGAVICLWMNSIAPISTVPRVGCPINSRSGPTFDLAARTTFAGCAPEKILGPQGADLGGRTSKALHLRFPRVPE